MADQNWITTVMTTTSKYLKEEEVNILRHRALLAMLESKGRITYNFDGKDIDWPVQFSRAGIRTFVDGQVINYNRQDRDRRAVLPYRSYFTDDMMSKEERLKNRGDPAIIKRYENTLMRMTDDIREGFCDELYNNGYAAGNTGMHGIESFMETTGTDSDKVELPTSTYAGLSCAVGNYGGTWTGNWPIGKGDAKYDFWSPLLVSYTRAAWGGSTHTWETHGYDAIRYAITHCNVRKSKTGKPDLCLVDPEMYRTLKSVIDDKERINVENNYGLVKLGFMDTIQIDGCDVTHEYGVPADTGYLFNTSQMEIVSLQPQLFVSTGPVLDESTMTYRFLIDFYGNCKFNPRGQAKLYSYG